MLKKKSLKQTLAEGRLICGYEVMSCSPIMVEMVGYCGFDFVFIDSEHVPMGSDMDLVHLIRAAEASGAYPIVRVKENTEPFIRVALESGAQGVIVPHIKTKQDAENAVKHARLPLRGRRGTSTCVRSSQWQCGGIDLEEFVRRSNEEALLIALFEDKEFVDNFESIQEVDGIDAYCFGPMDFAMTIGVNLPKEPKHPRINEAFKLVVGGAKKKGLPILNAVIPATAERSKELFEMGVKFQLFGTDLDLISGAFNDLAKNVLAKIRRT